ncbi:hypothetical protein Mycch_4044 [Mycolicibacterium chubuense NBB4]|uniref:DUF6542 domain-containing protein n=1 Tax=Mycolicibacterium chubuense (strain NBB4) TaxID=710421 RepID=I4BNA9_MYCCN|nr:hypothetical protein Mycch_4044 [Mycolicibacterium chubuense NBB4]
MPWWGAVLIAVVASVLGFAFDAGSGGGQLTGAFSALYVIGCVAAVLAVRQANVFTAVIQPPLLLFVAVPGAYFLMHSSDIHGIKDILINCGYPLIERFPLMLFTAAVVLLLGIGRWFLGRSAAQNAAADAPAPARGSRLAAKISSLIGGADEATPAEDAPRRRHSAERRRNAKPAPGRAARTGARSAKRAASSAEKPSRSHHTRPADTEIIEPVVDRPRRRRPRPAEAPASETRRRTRSASDRERRSSLPPTERRASYDRPERAERERPQRSARPRPPRPSRYDGYEPLEPHGGGPLSGGTHHPVSRVRYRGEGDTDDQPEYRTRRRAPRDFDADRWEYDI